MKSIVLASFVFMMIIGCGESEAERLALTNKYASVEEGMFEANTLLLGSTVPGRDGIKQFEELHGKHSGYYVHGDKKRVECRHEKRVNNETNIKIKMVAGIEKDSDTDKFADVTLEFKIYRNGYLYDDDVRGFTRMQFDKYMQIFGEAYSIDEGFRKYSWQISDSPAAYLVLHEQPIEDGEVHVYVVCHE